MDDLQEDIGDLEGTNEELREEIQALEQALNEISDTVSTEDPETTIEEGTATLRQAFSSDVSEDDVLVVWKDADGSSTTISEEHWSIDSSLFGGDTVVVEDYPIPENSAGATSQSRL